MDLFDDLPAPSNDSILPTLKEKIDKDGGESITCESPVTGEKRKNDTEVLTSNKKLAQSQSIHRVKGFAAARRGEREDMQDAHVIIEDFFTSHKSDTPCQGSYFAVFDGHGGDSASKFAAEHLHRNLLARLPVANLDQIESDIKKCFVDAFRKTDEDFLREARKVKPSRKDGSTAVAVLALNGTLYIANLGDSKAVLCRSDVSGVCNAIPLTRDHTPTLYDERKRIQKAGGQVRDGRVMGVLEVSRSLGDGPYKKHGVSCVPEIKRCQLTEQDRFVLIACDGLWKTFDNQTAVTFINDTLADTTIEMMADRFEAACSRLASEAVRKLSADNVTVLLVRLNGDT